MWPSQHKVHPLSGADPERSTPSSTSTSDPEMLAKVDALDKECDCEEGAATHAQHATGGGTNPANPPAKAAQARWKSATTKVAATNRLRHPLDHVKKMSVIDMYATEPSPKSLEGGWLTLAVWMATVVYLIVMVVQWVRRPPTTQSAPDWTIGLGPWDMRLQCHAASGCLYSNQLTDQNTLNVASDADPSKVNTCIKMAHKEEITAQVVFSIHPHEGISVLYDPTTTDEDMIEGFGVTAASEIRCRKGPGEEWEKGCVVILKSMAGPGTATIQYVQTDNKTEIGAARHRQEFFLKAGGNNGTLEPRATPCSPDPSWTQVTQTRLPMSSFFHTVDVSKDGFWLFLWGSAGGAFSSFFQVAGLILILYTFGVKIYEKVQKVRAKRALGRAIDDGNDNDDGSGSVAPTLGAVLSA